MSTIEDSAQPQIENISRFGVSVDVEGRSATLRPRGEIDVATAPEVERHARALWSEGTEALVLDLSAVSFFDSSGLRLLIRLQALADERAAASFALADCAPVVMRILELTHLSARFARA